jgi:hypothetical protein
MLDLQDLFLGTLAIILKCISDLKFLGLLLMVFFIFVFILILIQRLKTIKLLPTNTLAVNTSKGESH